MSKIGGAIQEYWSAVREAAGIRWQVFALLVSIVVARLDWIYRASGGGGDMIFGFPSWILGATVGLAFLFAWMLEANVRIRRQIKVAGVELAELRQEGVRLRNDGRRSISSAAAWQRWEREALDWNERVIAALAKSNEGDAKWFAVLDVVPAPRLPPQGVQEEFQAAYEKLYREHDFRVMRLGDMIQARGRG